MNRQEFLDSLRVGLSGLPQEDIEKSLEFYGEAIDDRIESGLSEEEAVNEVGTVDEIVEQILSETPLPKLIRSKVTPNHALKVWEIILIVLGSPIWFSLLLAAVVTVFAVYAAIWSVVIAVYAVVLAFALSGIALLINSIGVLLFAGAGLTLIGLSILLFFAANQIAKGILFFSRKIILVIKSMFIRKEERL